MSPPPEPGSVPSPTTTPAVLAAATATLLLVAVVLAATLIGSANAAPTSNAKSTTTSTSPPEQKPKRRRPYKPIITQDAIALQALVVHVEAEAVRKEEAARHERQHQAAAAAAAAARAHRGPDGTLRCIRKWESDSSGGYVAVSPNGKWFGAYQFDMPTWEGAVTRAGYPEYAGTRPDRAPPHVQDAAAAQLLSERGLQPWPTPAKMCA